MKRMISLIVIFLFSNHVAFCSQQETEQPQPFATNGMLIFLDNIEKNISGPLSLSFLSSLTQQVGPILVSTSLVQAIQSSPSFEDILNNPKSSESEILIAKFGLGYFQAVNATIDTVISKKKIASPASLTNQEKSYITDQIEQTLRQVKAALENKLSIKKAMSLMQQNPNLASLLRSSYHKYTWPFNWNNWIIKMVNPDLLLLIPKKEIEKREQQSVNLPQSKLFSPLELALGLKIDHIQDVNSVAELVKNYSAPNDVNYFIPALPQIFITNQEYAQVNQQSNTKMPLPTWFMYLEGHGIAAPGMEGRIAKLPTSDFKLFLDFLETKIKTKLLAYVSCFAAGANADAVYKDLKTQIFKTYPFTIITGVLIDAPTKQQVSVKIFPRSKDIDFVNKRIFPDSVTHFIPFFHDLTTQDTINYAQVFSHVWPTPDSKEFIQSFPQIKLAGIPWFNIADSNKKVVTIGKTMAKTRTEPLNVTQFFKTQPLAILLQTNVIPFPLIITMYSMPVLISMLPGDAQHSFKELQIPDITLPEFIKSFGPITETTYLKRYVFHSLVVREGNSKKTYRNLVVVITGGESGVYQVSQDGSVLRYEGVNKNTWRTETDQEWIKKARNRVKESEALLNEYENAQLQQFGKARKEQSQKLILPKEIPAMPGEEKPFEEKPTKLPTPAQQSIPATKIIEPAKPIEQQPAKKPVLTQPTLPTSKIQEQEKPVEKRPIPLPIPVPIISTPQTTEPEKPASQKITPVIAPKHKPVAKPVPQKATPKKLSPASSFAKATADKQLKKQQQAKLKKQKLEQAKKAAAKKKQMIAKKKLAAKQAAAKKKVISKKAVVLKKKPSVAKAMADR